MADLESILSAGFDVFVFASYDYLCLFILPDGCYPCGVVDTDWRLSFIVVLV
jgi:hypothetical protein